MLKETTLFVIVGPHTMMPIRLREEVLSAGVPYEAGAGLETSTSEQEAGLDTLPTESPERVARLMSRERKVDRGLKAWTIRFLKLIRIWGSSRRE